MTCRKAQGFLEANRVQVNEQQDASKWRNGPKEAIALARSADTVIVAKGKKIVRFEMRKNPPDDETLLAHLLGPTGNLRAPTARRGKTLLVGFSEEVYRETLE